MDCFRCDQEAVQECPRCGAVYCDDHGEALCARCMDPALALPSYRIYRGSLAALFVGSVVAVWLLVLPPAGADQDGPPLPIAAIVSTPTATATPAPTPSPTPIATATSPSTPVDVTPTATPTPEPTPTPTPEPRTYTVQSGDTLYGIAERFAPSSGQLESTAQAIQRANGITNPSSLQVGQVLVIPD